MSELRIELVFGDIEMSMLVNCAVVDSASRVRYFVGERDGDGRVEISRADFDSMVAAMRSQAIDGIVGVDGEKGLLYQLDLIREQLNPDIDGSFAGELLAVLRTGA